MHSRFRPREREHLGNLAREPVESPEALLDAGSGLVLYGLVIGHGNREPKLPTGCVDQVDAGIAKQKVTDRRVQGDDCPGHRTLSTIGSPACAISRSAMLG